MNSSHAPLISVLITTYNRSRLLRRAIASVLKQSFGDFEIVIIDDCSTDDTAAVVASMADARIRYIRNETNIGSARGDRPHVRRFVYDLMQGKYFVYLCDDDYWLPSDLLERQLTLLQNNPNLAFAFGNQLSYFVDASGSYFGGDSENPVTLTRENLAPYFDFAEGRSQSPHLGFSRGLFPKGLMTSEEFLDHFAKNAVNCNRIVGATLYSRAHFVAAGAMSSESGSAWQAGYEFLMGPACTGDVAYLDEPAIVTEIREQNASFQRTQIAHYFDSIKSIDAAFEHPCKTAETPSKKRFLEHVEREAIRSLTHAFVRNTVTIRLNGNLAMCSPENMAHAVEFRHMVSVYARHGVWPNGEDLKLMRALFYPNAEVLN